MSAAGIGAIASDVVVLGGGLVGLSTAVALGQAGLSVVVVDREKPAVAAADPFDGRGSAIAWGSAQALRGIGLWPLLEGRAAPIEEIRVTDGESLLFLHYDHREVGGNPLGYIVENRFIRRALYARIAALETVTLLAPMQAIGVERSNARASVTLADGRRIRARLVIAADGRESPTRRAAGIGVMRWSYRQTAIVCSIRHRKPHRGVAHERFLAAGPFAVLPLPDSESGEHRSSIVWTERDELAPAMLALNDTEFAEEIALRFGDSLGEIGVAGPRWAYPLSLLQADRYTDLRLALVGDAAHVIHPIAGQGLNLGLRDVAAIAECIVDAHRLGLDVGATDALERYARWRRFDNLTLLAVTDGLVRLFSTDMAPVRLARDLGLAAVQRLPGLKRFFMRHAMGVVGDPPRLVRGEAL
ncbi:MAG TPA: UbiH/UbiF/VisC/COQ6 family ubiquinone biosynthesis hydroxylase [Alphaproteobacteria bacterium]|nr:UbiH/UbiF/VisC/COQ6 family ubiquinone biosynthesis hydroxylase [Alphaproteobacteria bacterium]